MEGEKLLHPKKEEREEGEVDDSQMGCCRNSLVEKVSKCAVANLMVTAERTSRLLVYLVIYVQLSLIMW